MSSLRFGLLRTTLQEFPTDPMQSPVVLVFVRHYAAGPVKTRLAQSIGQVEARNIYRGLAERVWQSIRAREWCRWLLVEPPTELNAAQAWLAGADDVRGQSAGDLGTRLRKAFDAAFAAGAPKVCAIGSDAPELDSSRIDSALRGLEQADVVAIPALDGGYALLGLKMPAPALFENIAWGTAQVLQQTRSRASQMGLSWLELEAIRDLDTVADLLAFEREGFTFRKT